eukprot:6089962-Amphidinium_carterae.2
MPSLDKTQRSCLPARSSQVGSTPTTEPDLVRNDLAPESQWPPLRMWSYTESNYLEGSISQHTSPQYAAMDSARSDDSGMLPQCPTRRQVVKPAHVPTLDLSKVLYGKVVACFMAFSRRLLCSKSVWNIYTCDELDLQL